MIALGAGSAFSAGESEQLLGLGTEDFATDFGVYDRDHRTWRRPLLEAPSPRLTRASGTLANRHAVTWPRWVIDQSIGVDRHAISRTSVADPLARRIGARPAVLTAAAVGATSAPVVAGRR